MTAAEEGLEKKAMSPCAILRPRGGQNKSPIDELDPARPARPTPRLSSHVHNAKQTPTSPSLPPSPRLVSDHHGCACQGRRRLQVCPPSARLLLLALSAGSCATRCSDPGCGGFRAAAQEEETPQVEQVPLPALSVVAWPRLTCNRRCCLFTAGGYGHGHECQHTTRVSRQPPEGDRQPHAAAGLGHPDKHPRRCHCYTLREV